MVKEVDVLAAYVGLSKSLLFHIRSISLSCTQEHNTVVEEVDTKLVMPYAVPSK